MTDDLASQAPALIGVGAQSIVDRAKSLGLTWTLRPATITTYNSFSGAITATYDGDTVPISFVNITGDVLTVGQRVMGLQIPPSGNFILGNIGRVFDKTILASFISFTQSTSTVAGAPLSTEVSIGSLSSFNFQSGRCYEFHILGGFDQSAANTSGNVKLRQSGTGGTILWDYWWTPPVPGGGGAIGPMVMSGPGYIRRSPLSVDTSITVTVTLRTNNSATGVNYADATHPRGIFALDCGEYADFPWAFSI